MTVTTQEILRGVKTASSYYSQIQGEADLATNTAVMKETPTGGTHPRFAAANGSRDEIAFTTKQIATALAEFGNLGASVGPLDAFYQKVNSLTSRVDPANLEHTRLRAALGRAQITQISAGHQSDVTAAIRAVGVGDGVNEAFARTANNALTDLPTTAENFVLGPISFAGTALEGCDGFNLAFNPTYMEMGDESDENITFAAGDNIDPVVSFSTTDPAASALHKTAVSNFRFHFLRKKSGTTRYTDAELQHIRGLVANGTILVQSIGKEKRVEVHATGSDAGGWTDAPVAWSINVAVALT